jgi:hypothetical protein
MNGRTVAGVSRWRDRGFATLVVGFAAAATAACDVLGTGDEEFVIAVDSIVAPAAIAPDDTLRVRFHGQVGPDGCSRLVSVERRASAAELEVRFHGARRRGSYCTQMPVPLDHTETVRPPLVDPFTVTARQPGGAMVNHVLRIGAP